jgi:hypothetical protein
MTMTLAPIHTLLALAALIIAIISGTGKAPLWPAVVLIAISLLLLVGVGR